MTSNDAIEQGFIPYPYTFPAIKFQVECNVNMNNGREKKMTKCTIQDNHEFEVISTWITMSFKSYPQNLSWEKCALCNLSITRIIKTK